MFSSSRSIAELEESFARQEAMLDEWVGLSAQIGAVEAQRAVVLADRLDQLVADRLEGDEMALRSLCAEFAAAAHVAPSTMESQLTTAWMLVRRLPVAFASLAAGRITKRHADAIVHAAPVGDAVVGERGEAVRTDYEAQVVPFAEKTTAARTRVHAQGVTAKLGHESLVDSHRRARHDRTVTVRSDGDGMAVLTAVLPEVLAWGIHDRLTAMADSVIEARPEGQRRPRASALAKIRAEREAALAAQRPSGEPDDDDRALDAEMAQGSRYEPVPPWESEAAGGDDQGDDECSGAVDGAGGDVAEAADGAGDRSPVVEESEYPSFLDEEPGLDGGDAYGVGPDGEALFRDAVPIHDGFGPMEPDSRSKAQLRADILADLLLTGAPTATTADGSADAALGAIRATVQVTIAASTLRGDDDRMAELAGHGPMLPDAARLLAGQAGSWDRLFLDPDGTVTETDNYVPTAAMKRFLRARDQHCRFPGCRAPVHRCQIDHNHDHAKGGPTAIGNLSLFCAGHHALKHPDVDDRDRWTARQFDDGVIMWTSPLGRRYTDEPQRHVMFV